MGIYVQLNMFSMQDKQGKQERLEFTYWAGRCTYLQRFYRNKASSKSSQWVVEGNVLHSLLRNKSLSNLSVTNYGISGH